MTTRRRILILCLATTIVAVVGTVSIKADPLCRRLVRELHEKRVRNRVSKATAERWAAWNKTHPNFHPKARPKYKIVPEEVVKQVEFACAVPVAPKLITSMIPPQPPPEMPEITFGPIAPPVLPPPELPSVTEIATADTPPPPFLPPYFSGAPPGLSPVPEPSSFWLLFSGMICLCGRLLYSKRKLAQAS